MGVFTTDVTSAAHKELFASLNILIYPRQTKLSSVRLHSMNGGTKSGFYWRFTVACVCFVSHCFPVNIDWKPGNAFTACFEAPAAREMGFCERFGRPRLCVERYLRELH